ncbi:DNA polymerase alpha/epsilon subunit B-domain-containing protein [Tuber brumale]|nr:DNA polymerase alpha/epsilon subunit B-domain-containing protein [Tuber brumale]
MGSASKKTSPMDLLSDEEQTYPTHERVRSAQTELEGFTIGDRSYERQFATMYFLRLVDLKPSVEAVALKAWEGTEIGGETVERADRVLEVRQGELCWIVGTIYMEMPLKPNILEDITKNQWIAAPPPRDKYVTPGADQTMLEDESGRLRLVGKVLERECLVTGVVVGVMGTETKDGDFDVVDVIVPELPPQENKLDIGEGEKKKGGKRKVALVSGLSFKGNAMENFETELLAEYLLGEVGGVEDQESASKITRLIIAGNSLAPAVALPPVKGEEKHKKYGYDSTTYNANPALALDNLLTTLLPSLPVTILPGPTDPANVSLPQKPLHPAIFRNAKHYAASSLHTTTNPCCVDIDGLKFLGTAGQNLDDVYKYVEGEDRLGMCERLLRWRCVAPTAPDTLWSFPFEDKDMYVIKECPHVFFMGNQEGFASRLVKGPQNQLCRIILIPKFSETNEVVLLDLDTLECESVKFGVENGTGSPG